MSLVPLHEASAPDLAERVADGIQLIGVSAATGAVDQARVAELTALVDEGLKEDERCTPGDRDIDVGRVAFLPRYGRAALDLLDDDTLMSPCELMLGADCTLYTMTTLCQPPGSPGRPQHVDVRYATPGFVLGLGVMVLLDDFTSESGPTRMYPEVTVDPPSPDDFEARALRLEAPAGTACWFHGRIWHDAMPNRTDRWRRAILLAMIRPYVRQRFDMPRMVAHLDVDTLSSRVRQKLGFELIAPGSYEEYFLPGSTRKGELLRRAVERA